MVDGSRDRLIADVTLVTVTYNSAKLAEFFGQSAHFFKQVVVVDNHSADATVEEFSKTVPHAKVLPLEKNIGFGPGNNAGLKKVNTPYALLMITD